MFFSPCRRVSVSSQCSVLCKSHLISFSSGRLENMVQVFFFPPSKFIFGKAYVHRRDSVLNLFKLQRDVRPGVSTMR